ncbi:MAG: ABC transporter ATP-binding protein [Verrucomicrobiia bacterium]
MFPRFMQGIHVRRGLELVWVGGRRWIIAGLVLTLLLGTLPVAALYLQKLIFDVITSILVKANPAGMSVLAWLVVGLGLVEVVGGMLRSLLAYVTEAQAESVQDFVMSKLHNKSIELDLGFYETPSYFDSLHVAQTEAPKRTAQFVQVLSPIGQDALALVAVVALILTYNWAVAALLFVAFVPGLIIHVRSSNKLYHWQKAAAARQREAGYYHELLTHANAAKESRVFGFGPVVASWYTDLRGRLRSELLAISRWKQTRVFVVNVCGVVALFAGVYYFARATVQGVYTVGDMALFYAAFYRAQTSLRAIISGISALYESNLFLGNLFEVLDTKPAIASNGGVKRIPTGKTGIAFEGVSFRYPGSEREAVWDLTLTIAPGEHLAIVGKNGSGKSTFVKLLCRWYDRSEGMITLDGRDIQSYDLQAYRRRFSVLFQDYLQFGLSVERNIWLANTDTAPDKSLIREMGVLSGADDVVQRLPRGYDTVLGKVLSDGEQLSQGEWQKVALARALFRQADITILDEPTSWMDPESEQEFFEKFHQVSKGRTAIMISHRLSTVKMVDRIVVMESGRIIEIGTHDQLVSQRGRYFELFETQARSYR